MIASDFTSLLDLANEIARDRRVGLPAVIKELLHYEILQALMVSGSARYLVFQGGTALRLCHNGVRYSEDLDFAGGKDFDPLVMAPFVEQFKQSVNKMYNLPIAVSEDLPSSTEPVSVARWKAKIALPQVNPSVKQSHVIRIEVANVPAYSHDVAQIRTMSTNLPEAYRTILLTVESKQEILADKLVALGARHYVKQRDLWDIHMLNGAEVRLDTELVEWKLRDYSLNRIDFIQTLQNRIANLLNRESISAFQAEMSRFLEGPHQSIIKDHDVVQKLLTEVSEFAKKALVDLASS